MTLTLLHFNEETQEYEAYAWLGGYPLHYITEDCGILCPLCATENKELDDKSDPQWCIIRGEVNCENPNLYCDHCNVLMECAYVPNGAHAILCPARPIDSKAECTCNPEPREEKNDGPSHDS